MPAPAPKIQVPERTLGPNTLDHIDHPTIVRAVNMLNELTPEARDRLDERPSFWASLTELIEDETKPYLHQTLFAKRAVRYHVPATAGKSTASCLVGVGWGTRGGEFAKLLPENQRPSDETEVVVLTTLRAWTYQEAMRLILNDPQKLTFIEICALYLAKGHDVTLPQLEHLTKATKQSEKTGLHLQTNQNYGFTCRSPVPLLRNGLDPAHADPEVIGLHTLVAIHTMAPDRFRVDSHVERVNQGGNWACPAGSKLIVANPDLTHLDLEFD